MPGKQASSRELWGTSERLNSISSISIGIVAPDNPIDVITQGYEKRLCSVVRVYICETLFLVSRHKLKISPLVNTQLNINYLRTYFLECILTSYTEEMCLRIPNVSLLQVNRRSKKKHFFFVFVKQTCVINQLKIFFILL